MIPQLIRSRVDWIGRFGDALSRCIGQRSKGSTGVDDHTAGTPVIWQLALAEDAPQFLAEVGLSAVRAHAERAKGPISDIPAMGRVIVSLRVFPDIETLA